MLSNKDAKISKIGSLLLSQVVQWGDDKEVITGLGCIVFVMQQRIKQMPCTLGRLRDCPA